MWVGWHPARQEGRHFLTYFNGFLILARNSFAGDVSMKQRFIPSGNKRSGDKHFNTPTRLAPKGGEVLFVS